MVPYAKRIENMAFTAEVVKGLFGAMTNPDIISFSGGSPTNCLLYTSDAADE